MVEQPQQKVLAQLQSADEARTPLS